MLIGRLLINNYGRNLRTKTGMLYCHNLKQDPAAASYVSHDTKSSFNLITDSPFNS